MLTTDQLAVLRQDLYKLANIEYDEVFNELLDHYATRTEDYMANGLGFTIASAKAWADLGSGKGIQRIQREYEKSLLSTVSDLHKAIIKSYFRWPTVATTLLVGLLIYFITPFVNAKTLILCLYAVSFLPILFTVYGYRKNHDQLMKYGKTAWQYIQNTGALGMNMGTLSLMAPADFLDDGANVAKEFLQTYTGVAAAICFVYVIYLFSFFQLYRTLLQLKPA